MKPDNQAPSVKMDQLPAIGGVGVESIPGAISPELGQSKNIEKSPTKTDPIPVAPASGPVTTLPTPVASGPAANDGTAVADAPLIAKDDDLIEKEWVDKAKQIVNQTKDNPHQRDSSVTKLKVDYLKKRFGRELGASE